MNFGLLIYISLLPISSSLYAMDIDEPEFKGSRHLSLQENANPQAHVNSVTECYYERTYPFSPPKTKINEVIKDALKEIITPQELRGILEKAAHHGDTKSQERLYQLYTHKLGSIDLVNNELAEATLTRGLGQKKPWAYWEKAKMESQEGKVTKWHCLAANQTHPEALNYIQKNLRGYKEQINQFILCFLKSQSVALRQRLVDQFMQKWSRLCYATPFREVVLRLENRGLSSDAKKQLLKKAADFGCVDSIFYLAFTSQTYPSLLHYMGTLTSLERLDDICKRLGKKIDQLVKSAQSIIPAKDLSSLQKRTLYQILERMAETGNRLAIDCLGHGLAQGFLGLPPDWLKAQQYLEVLHADGSPKASYAIGCFYNQGGFGIQQNRELALPYFEKAAQHKNLEAMYNAACILREGSEGDSTKKKKALSYYIRAANLGNRMSACNAALMLMRGDVGKPDLRKAIRYFKMSIEGGYQFPNGEHVMVYHNIGSIYDMGFPGQKQNPKLAFTYLKKAAELGEPYSMCWVGLYLLSECEGQPPVKMEALKWLKKSADQGDAEAAFQAGYLLYKGFPGQQIDLKQSIKYFQKSADLGHSMGCFNTALLYQTAFEDQLPNDKMALHYYKEAAKSGIVDAICNLGSLLLIGYEEQDPNPKEALIYYKEASRLGDPLAMELMGLLLTTDEFCNLEISKNYFLQASYLGNTRAMIGLVRHYLGFYSPASVDLEKVMFWLEKAHSLGEPLAERFSLFREKVRELNATEEEDSKSDLAFEELIHESQNPASSLAKAKVIKGLAQDEKISRSNEKKPPLIFIESESKLEEISEDQGPSKKKITNPKFLRAKLREAYSLKKEKEHHDGTPIKLSKQASDIAKKILSKRALKNNELLTLFKDPFFKGQVLIETTKSGICIIGHNRATDKHCTYGDHRQHTKRYKGDFSPAFIADLRRVLKLFGITMKSLTM